MRSNNFTTGVVCIALVLLRIFSQILGVVDAVVFGINIVAMLYVWYVIFFDICKYLEISKEKNQVCNARYNRFITFRKKFWLYTIILAIVYEIVLYLCNPIKPYASCVNDILSVITLGISIEDEKIKEIIKGHYDSLAIK